MRNLVYICSECSAIKTRDNDNTSWKEVNHNTIIQILQDYDYKLSHGYCTPCAERIIKQIDKGF